MRALVVSVFALALVPAAGGSGSASPVTLRTAGPVTLLAADGPLAAAVVKGNGHGRCTQIVLWKPGRATATVKTMVGCGGGTSLEGVAELALGGKRVIWQETNGGNNLELIVETATESKVKDSMVSYVENGNGAAGDPGGDYTGHLLADGPLMVFARWIRCDPYGGGYAGDCAKSKPELSAGALYQVAYGKDKVLRRGVDMLFPVWVDGGRILVRTQDSKLTLLRTSGATIRTFDVGADYATAVFQGTTLIVLRQTALDIYDSATGAKVHSFSLSNAPRQLVDLQSGIAVLISGGAVHLIQVGTGKGATVKPPGGGTISAQLEPSGLFYSSASGVGFVPMPNVLARFR